MRRCTARDAAAYILSRTGSEGTTKLLKLLYYGQAWSLVWDGEPLFDDPIEAWNAGPVVRQVWQEERYDAGVRGDPHVLTPAQRATLDGVIEFYSGFSGRDLSELTHRELPWMDARARGQNTPIPPAELAKFYGGLEELRDCNKSLPESYRSGVRFLLTMTPDEVDDLYALGTELPLEPAPSWLSDC